MLTQLNRWTVLAVLASTSLVWAGAAPEPIGQVFGFYSAGKLFHATALPAEGKGLLHLFRARNRMWGSQGMIEVLEHAASEIFDHFPGSERLQVGDIAAQSGGFVSGHASHQNGLDADVGYFRRNLREQNPNDLGGFDENFVVGSRLTVNFDQKRNWRLMTLLVGSGRVHRIFVDPVIKAQLCKFARSAGEYNIHAETLRRLRPYPNHADHLHVRLTCPSTSPACKEQEELPPGTGCPSKYSNELPPVDPTESGDL